MKHLIFLLFFGFAILTLTQCYREHTNSPAEMRDLNASEQSLVETDNSFGLKLFKEIVSEEEADKNIFISPLSVSMALGMTYNGANGVTREAMAQTLELNDLTIEEANQAYQSLIHLLLNLDPKVKFLIANSIWYRQEWTFEATFLNTCLDYFGAEIRGLDFNDPHSVDVINNWADDATNGKIDQIITEIDPLTVMFLINAIYFNGTWTYEFDPNDTQTDVFTKMDGSEIPCQMMQIESDLFFLDNDLFQAVDLPYGDGQFRMTIFLPDPQISIDEMIMQFDENKLTQWIYALEEHAVQLELPKFKLEYEIYLNDVLKALGMEIAFNEWEADFSNMFKPGGLFISNVKHQTFVEVDEEGTEAAAVTVVEISLTSIGGGSFSMRVDRPFFFVIREKKTGAIVFMGKVLDPVYE